jgi:hypothetical protein
MWLARDQYFLRGGPTVRQYYIDGQSMIEDNVHELLQGHELCRRRQDAILTKGVAYKESIILNQSLCTHVFERCFSQEGKSRLGKLGRVEKFT